MILKEVQTITPGDLIERTRGHRSGQIALVTASGTDKYQVILRNWLRIQYLKLGDYEWVQKDGVARVSRD